MWIFVYIAFFLAAIFSYASSQGDSGATEIKISASEEIKQYKAFMTAADQYFSDSDRIALKRLYWQDIKVSAPSGMNMADMRSSWYVIKGDDGAWSACTDISEEAMASIAQLFPDAESGPKIQKKENFYAVGDAEVAESATLLCRM